MASRVWIGAFRHPNSVDFNSNFVVGIPQMNDWLDIRGHHFQRGWMSAELDSGDTFAYDVPLDRNAVRITVIGDLNVVIDWMHKNRPSNESTANNVVATIPAANEAGECDLPILANTSELVMLRDPKNEAYRDSDYRDSAGKDVIRIAGKAM